MLAFLFAPQEQRKGHPPPLLSSPSLIFLSSYICVLCCLVDAVISASILQRGVPMVGAVSGTAEIRTQRSAFSPSPRSLLFLHCVCVFPQKSLHFFAVFFLLAFSPGGVWAPLYSHISPKTSDSREFYKLLFLDHFF